MFGSRWTRGIGVLFALNGFGWANWVPRIPEVQEGLGLSIATLGLVLAGYGTGGFIGSFASGPVIDRFGSRSAAITGSVAIGLTLPAIALAPNALIIAIVFVAAGAFDALADLGMNAQGAEAQKRRGSWLMGKFHAGWSVGTMTGAALGSLAARIDVSLWLHLGTVGLIVTAAALWSRTTLEVIEPAARQAGTRGVTRGAVVLAGLAVLVAIAEGSASDWSAVIARDVYSQRVVGLMFVGFSAAMLVGRLITDRAIEQMGVGRTARISAGLAMAGVLGVVAAPNALWAIAGFALLGLGMAALFPILYNSAASDGRTSVGTGLALMSVGGRLGFIAGPVLIGYLGDVFGLTTGFGVVVFISVALIAVAAARFDSVNQRV